MLAYITIVRLFGTELYLEWVRLYISSKTFSNYKYKLQPSYFSQSHRIDAFILDSKNTMVSISSRGIFGRCLSRFHRNYESKMMLGPWKPIDLDWELQEACTA